jgi:hypothetical protein
MRRAESLRVMSCQESAVSLDLEELQVPRSTRDDNQARGFFKACHLEANSPVIGETVMSRRYLCYCLVSHQPLHAIADQRPFDLSSCDT